MSKPLNRKQVMNDLHSPRGFLFQNFCIPILHFDRFWLCSVICSLDFLYNGLGKVLVLWNEWIDLSSCQRCHWFFKTVNKDRDGVSESWIEQVHQQHCQTVFYCSCILNYPRFQLTLFCFRTSWMKAIRTSWSMWSDTLWTWLTIRSLCSNQAAVCVILLNLDVPM